MPINYPDPEQTACCTSSGRAATEQTSSPPLRVMFGAQHNTAVVGDEKNLGTKTRFESNRRDELPGVQPRNTKRVEGRTLPKKTKKVTLFHLDDLLHHSPHGVELLLRGSLLAAGEQPPRRRRRKVVRRCAQLLSAAEGGENMVGNGKRSSHRGSFSARICKN